MRMSHEKMFERVLAGDPAYNGHFFFGVLTTGIYCLPTCKARKPKPENVRFFANCLTARAAGLRACKKCHPDDFEKGADPVLEMIERLVAEVRAEPAKFPDARSIVQRSGFGVTRAIELFRQHFHTTPSELLLKARLAAAKRLLRSNALVETTLADIAFAVGFESMSVFHENFRIRNGLTPAAYRELRFARSFSVSLPEGFPRHSLRHILGRDVQSVTERLRDDTYECVVEFSSGPALLTLRLGESRVEVLISDGPGAEAHALVIGLLGLDQDVEGFGRHVRKLGLERLIEGREGLRLSQTPSVFDGLLWSIIGQQINLPFAFVLKRRLVEKTCLEFADGLRVAPTPEAIAALNEADLLPLQFSRQKASYLVRTARLITEGKLELDGLLKSSATRAERTLLEVRGLGPWSVNYLMMRSLGFSDCVPLGDTGVTSGLVSLFTLTKRPELDETRRLMAPLSPYRSLATAHLWQLNRGVAE